MKVIHVPFSYYPDPVGGTEVYVETLVRSLVDRGIECLVAAPAYTSQTYLHNGVKVVRFALSEVRSSPSLLNELYGEGDLAAAQRFARILDIECPDVLHMHAFGRGCSLRLIREARLRGIIIVFTYHTPTVSCQRGTLLRWGQEICQGVIRISDCAACTLQDHGIAKPISQTLACVPPEIGRLVEVTGLSGGLWTALRMSQLMKMRKSAFQGLVADVSHIVVLCQWTKELLLRNGVPKSKVSLCRHGLENGLPDSKLSTLGIQVHLGRRADSEQLRIAFLGRLHSSKGADLLIEAVLRIPKVNLVLDVFGIPQDAAGDEYLEHIKILAKGDKRIHFQVPVSTEQVVSLLKGYDLTAVPSRCLETGPLVVLESFAAGVPVLGSDLGGIAELIQHEGNGLLIQPNSVTAWAAAIKRCAEEGRLLQQLRAGTRRPRSASLVASEMANLYNQLIVES